MKEQMLRIWNAGKNNGFFTLITGTGVSQLIPIMFLPVLTRIYTPSDFGVVAVYLSLISVLGVCSSFRYEIAITQPKDDADSLSLLYICMLGSAAFSLIILIVLLMFYQETIVFFNLVELGLWIYLLPIGVFFSAIYQAFNYWGIRKGLYRHISYSAVTQSGITPSFQFLTAGNGGLLPQTNLVLGSVVGQLSGTLFLLYKIYPSFNFEGKVMKRIKNNLTKYKAFPLYSLPNAIAGSLALQAPVLFLTKFFEAGVVGAFSLVIRILNVPSSLMSSVLTNILLKKFSEDNYSVKKVSMRFLLRIILYLSIPMVPYILVIHLFGREIFEVIFGSEWGKAGEIASILVFSVAIRFVVSPLSSLLALEQHVKKGMLWQFSYLVFMLIVFFIFRDSNITQVLWAFVVYELIIYSVYLLVIFYACKQMNDRIS